MTTVAMKNGIILKAPKSDESLVEILEVCQDDTDYITELKKSLALGEKKSDAVTYWPSQVVRSRFNLEYNLRYGTMGNSLYSKSEYLFQLLPCLELIYALRKAFGIPVGVGRILNADEVMTYRYDPSTHMWHF